MFSVGTTFIFDDNKYTVIDASYPKTVDVQDGFFFLDDLYRWYNSGRLSIVK